MKIAVISMGQFISSDLSKLKQGFTEYFRIQNKPITGEEIWEWMSKNLESLRKDEITLAQFCQNLNDHFKTDMPFIDFQKIFNSMVELNSDALLRVSQFTELLNKNQDVTLVLVSHTNHSHLNFILEQVQSHLPRSYGIISIKNDWPNNARILFVPSMSSKCPDHPGTLNYALQKLGIDKDTPVVSFLNSIQTFPHPNFKYIKAEQVLDPNVLMNQLVEYKPVKEGFAQGSALSFTM